MKTEIDIELLKYWIIKGSIALGVAVILAGVFYSGAAISCKNGGGKLYALSCLTTEVVEVTFVEGQLYKLPSDVANCDASGIYTLSNGTTTTDFNKAAIDAGR